MPIRTTPPLVLLTLIVAAFLIGGCGQSGRMATMNRGVNDYCSGERAFSQGGYKDAQQEVRSGGLVTLPGGALGLRDAPAVALTAVGSAAFGVAAPLVLTLAFGSATRKQQWEVNWRDGYTPSECEATYAREYGRGINRGTYVRLGRDILLGSLIGLPIYFLRGGAKDDSSN